MSVRERSKKFTSSITHRILAMEFLSEFIFIYPFYGIMFGQRGAVSAAGIGVLLTTLQITTVVAEVPTGIIADKFSKKWVLLAAKLMKALAFLSWLLMPSFIGYFIGFILWGIAEALNSGAFQAYLYESLSADNKSKFGPLYARVNSMTAFAVLAAFGGSFIIGPRYNLLLVLSVLACLAAMYFAATLPAGERIVAEEKPRILAGAVKHIYGTVALRELLMGAIIVGCLANVLVEYMAFYYTQSGVSLKTLPLILAVGNIIGILLYWHMSKLEVFAKKYKLALLVGTGVVFAVSFSFGTFGVVLGYLVMVRVARFATVHYESTMQHLSQDATRATIGSIYSFVAKLLAAGLFMSIGFFAQNNIIIRPVRYAVLGTIGAFALSQILLSRNIKLRKNSGKTTVSI